MPSSHNYIVTFLLVGAVGCLPCAEYPEFYLLGLPPSRQLPGGLMLRWPLSSVRGWVFVELHSVNVLDGAQAGAESNQ